LTAVLGVITLLIVLLVLGRVTAVGLARLEALRGGLESGGGGVRSEGATLALALALLVDIQLLLSLPGQALILGSRIVLPRVEVRHGGLRLVKWMVGSM